MKHFMIKYQFANGTTEEWHREIGRFIAALDNDPELKGKIIYRCLKNRDDSSYYHLAAAADEQTIKTLQARETRPGLKVLFITGYAESAAISDGFLQPGMEMITKPFDLDNLSRRIRAMVSS